MKYFFLTALAISVYSFPALAQKPVKRPVVKKPATAQKVSRETPAVPKTLGLHVEKYFVNYEVNSDGTAVQTVESQTRFDSLAGIEGWGKIGREFIKGLEKIEVVDAYVVQKRTGKKVQLGHDKIVIAPSPQAEAAPAFSSVQFFTIDFTGLDVGDIGYYKYRLITTKAHFPGHFDEFDTLAAIFDWSAVEISLSAPVDYPLYTQTIGLEGGRLPDENGRARWHWKKAPSKALEFETSMYDLITPSARLTITSFKTYEELGAAFWAFAESKTTVTPEINELANRITKDLTDSRQQASAIYEWVNKNIRYLLVILDRGGWIPHDATQIVKNGYGDCKDYTILIHTLLKAKGIESYPVIIRSDMTDWAPEIASPGFYNHAILYIPSLDLFADATAPNTRLGLIPQSIVGKQGFLAGSKTGIIRTPGDRPSENEITSDVVVNYDDDGGMKSVSKNIYRGRSEIMFRPIFAGAHDPSVSEFMVKSLLSYYGITGSGRFSKVGNPFKVGEPFEIEMEADVPSPSSLLGKGTLPLPLAVNLLNMLDFQRLVIDEKRATNLVVGATHIRETFLLKFPESVTITAVPDPVTFEGPAGKFHCEFKITGKSVSVVRELSIKKDTIKPDEYAQLKSLVKAAVDGSSAEMTYERDWKLAKTPPPGQKTGTTPKAIGASNAANILSIINDLEIRALTAAEVKKLEASLLREPDNSRARAALLLHYDSYKLRKTPETEKTRIGHHIWFIQNHPDINLSPPATVKDAEYETLKAEWLKQVAQRPRAAKVRLNAVEYMERADPEAAISVLAEGEKIDPENYVFPTEIARLHYSRAQAPNVAENAKRADLTVSFEKGEEALALIKKERSVERDRARNELVRNLAEISLELKKYDRARTLATELILEVGDNFDHIGYQGATHSGNIVLGRAALAEGDIAKAKEHLLIAVRSLLRGRSPSFYRIDFELARELLAKGEKDVVAEYLQLCITFREKEEDKTMYVSDIATLKSWLEQVKAGKTPSFDFYKP